MLSGDVTWMSVGARSISGGRSVGRTTSGVAHGGPVSLVYIVGNQRQKGSEVVERDQSLRSNIENQLIRLFALEEIS